MTRGKKTDIETIYKVMLSYFTTGNANETARQLDMSESTIKDIVKRNKDKEEFVKLQRQKKDDFIEKTTRIIDKALNNLEKQVDKNQVAPNHLTTIVGTLYDKRALAKGKSTTNNTIRIEMSDSIKELSQ